MQTTNKYVLSFAPAMLRDARNVRYGNPDLQEYFKALYDLLTRKFSDSPEYPKIKKILDELLLAKEMLDESRQHY
jgi:hypothetical protein